MFLIKEVIMDIESVVDKPQSTGEKLLQSSIIIDIDLSSGVDPKAGDGNSISYALLVFLAAISARQNTISKCDAEKMQGLSQLSLKLTNEAEELKNPIATKEYKDPTQEANYLKQLTAEEADISNEKNYFSNLNLAVMNGGLKVAQSQANADVATLTQLMGQVTSALELVKDCYEALYKN